MKTADRLKWCLQQIELAMARECDYCGGAWEQSFIVEHGIYKHSKNCPMSELRREINELAGTDATDDGGRRP